MLNRLRNFLRFLVFTSLDTADPFEGYANHQPIPELPEDERADPLGLHTNTIAPSKGMTDVLCPNCREAVPARKFSSHLAYCEVRYWPYDGKPEDQELEW